MTKARVVGTLRVRMLFVGKATLCSLLAVALCRYGVLHWQCVAKVRPPLPGWLLLASAAALTSFLVSVCVNRVLLATHGYRVPYSRVVGLSYLPMLGKYVPGKVWSVLGAFWLYDREGIPGRIAAACVALSMLLNLVSGAVVVLLLGVGGVTPIGGTWLVGVIALVLVVCVHPRVFYPLVNLMLRMLRREQIVTQLSFSTLLGLLSIKTVVWLLYGTGFFCLVHSVSDVPLSSAPELIGVFAFAQIAGFVAIFAPAGIGVREGVFLVVLGPIVGEGHAIVITGLCRLWQTGLELLMAGCGWWALRSECREPPKDGSVANPDGRDEPYLDQTQPPRGEDVGRSTAQLPRT